MKITLRPKTELGTLTLTHRNNPVVCRYSAAEDALTVYAGPHHMMAMVLALRTDLQGVNEDLSEEASHVLLSLLRLRRIRLLLPDS